MFAGRRGRRPLRVGADVGCKTRDGPGKGTAARAGHAPPLRKKAAFFTNRKPCGKQMPRPLGRAGIKSEKAGFRLKNRLIVIFEVKSGFFPPLWGSRGAGPPGVGSALGRLTPAIRLAPDRACGCRRCLHLALPIFADAQMWPHAPNPASPRTSGTFLGSSFGHKRGTTPGRLPFPVSPQRDFSGTLLVTKEYEGPGRQPFPVRSRPVPAPKPHKFS